MGRLGGVCWVFLYIGRYSCTLAGAIPAIPRGERCGEGEHYTADDVTYQSVKKTGCLLAVRRHLKPARYFPLTLLCECEAETSLGAEVNRHPPLAIGIHDYCQDSLNTSEEKLSGRECKRRPPFPNG